jgi:hypothetical protein
MYSLRKVRNKSGSVAIQVVRYVEHRSIIAKHIGSAKDQTEEAVLRQCALEWIDEQTAQLSLFPAKKQTLLVVDRGDCFGVTHHFAFRFFMSCFDECCLSRLSCQLLDLGVMRLIEPASKYRSVEQLQYYFGIK